MKRYVVMFFVIAFWCAFLPGIKDLSLGGEVNAVETQGKESETESTAEPVADYKSEVKELTVYIEESNTACRLTVEEYTALALSGVMAGDSPWEALKAQGVVIRSFALHRAENPIHDGYDLCADPNCCYPLASVADKGCADAVDATRGLILCYSDNPILGLSHLSSCISTEAWGQGHPYLASVAVEDESSFACYKTHYSYSKKELTERLSLQAEPSEWLGEVKFTAGNRVQSICFGGEKFDGSRFAGLLGLSGLCFTVHPTGDGFDITCYGSGSGYGMSRCSAMLMAASGEGFEDILKHFYHHTYLAQIKT